MNRNVLRWFARATLVSVLLLPSGISYAQEEERDRGSIEVGVRQLYGDRSSAKFSEYRDIPQGFFIRHFETNLRSLLENRLFLNFQTRDATEEDQSYLLGVGFYRKYRLDAQWDQTPHVFTTTARTFFLQPSPGVFIAPAPLRTALESDRENLRAILDSSRILDLSLRRDKGAGKFTYTPTTDWQVQLGYSREKQVGYRQFGTTTNRFTNTVELPEPIDYRTHQVGLGTEYAKRGGGFQIGYSSSLFNNQVGELVWDNPFRLADASGSAARGQLDLYPDNSAHNLSFAGAVSIPHSTRLTASIVPGWMRQDDAFLPFTINAAIPNVPELPASSLDGRKQTLAMSYTVTNEAIPTFPLTFRYRSYDYNNNTPSLTFSQYVVTDSSLSSASIPRRSLPYSYDKKTVELDAAWEFIENSSAKFLYGFEKFDREHRDVEQSDEHTVGTAVDLSPNDWLLLRTSYKYSDRDPEEYEANEESFPLGEGTALGQIPTLRKFDEAARRRHRAEALLQITPVDPFSFGVSYGTTQDDYDESGHGLQKDISYNYTFEFSYNPHPAVSLFAEYTREKYKYRLRSRQRVPQLATTPVNDSPNNDWESDMRDLVHVWAVGWDGSLEDRAIFSTFYSLSTAENEISTRALGSASVSGFLVTTAQDFPDTSNRWHQLVASIRFPFATGFSPKLEYRYEKYDRVDFQLERLSEFTILDPGAANSIFLGVGADIPGYDAHIVSASLQYRF